MGKGGKATKEPSAKKAAKEGLLQKSGAATPQFKLVLGEIFRRFDKDGDDALCFSELDAFAKESQTGSLTAEDQAQLRVLFDCNAKGDLTLKGFEQMYLVQTNHQPDDTWKDLEKLGYAKSLELLTPPGEAEAAAAAKELAKAQTAELMAALAELKVAPESAAANRRVGFALEAMGREAQAQKSFAKAEELDGTASMAAISIEDQD